MGTVKLASSLNSLFGEQLSFRVWVAELKLLDGSACAFSQYISKAPFSSRSNISGCVPAQALGFHVWVAELELLVGNARGPGQHVDAAASMELLQKLQATLEGGSVARVREYQRRCEEALVELLLKGAAPPVRTSLLAAITRLIIPACAYLHTTTRKVVKLFIILGHHVRPAECRTHVWPAHASPCQQQPISKVRVRV